VVGVQAHLLPLVGVQRPGLLPDARPDRDPPEVVDQRRAAQRRGARRVDPAALRRRARELRHAGGVTGQVGGDQIGEVAHRRERAIEPVAGEHERWARLAGERLLPGRLVLVERENLARSAAEAGGHLRVERTSRALADNARSVLGAPQHALEGGVHGDVDDPHRQWDLLTLSAAERSPAVPALHEVGEETLHRRRKADPAGQHPCYLAHRGEVRTLLSGQLRQPARDLEGAQGHRPIGLGQRAEKPGEDLAPRPVHDRVETSRQGIAEDLSGDVRIGGAARVGKQAGVIGLRRRRGVDPEPVGESGRDQRAVQTVLERTPLCRGRWPGTAPRPAFAE
jgi:hypothetical protein